MVLACDWGNVKWYLGGLIRSSCDAKSKPGDTNPESNQDYAVQLWIDEGCPRHKLVMGQPAYGRSFTVARTSYKPGGSVSGAGTAGPFTQEAGFMAYYEICKKITDGWTQSQVSRLRSA